MFALLALAFTMLATPDSAPPPVVLFVCDHGSAKSVVAAAHFNRRAAERGLDVRATSRGTVPDEEMAPAAVAGLRADGLEPGVSKPRALAQADLDGAARVIAFGDLPPELEPRSPVERWQVPPVSADYEISRDAIVAGIDKLLDELEPRE